MDAKSRRIGFFFFLVFLCSILFSLVGLVFNVRTVALNSRTQSLVETLHQLEDENELLSLKILHEHRFDLLEMRAEDMGLIVPRRIHYFSND